MEFIRDNLSDALMVNDSDNDSCFQSFVLGGKMWGLQIRSVEQNFKTRWLIKNFDQRSVTRPICRLASSQARWQKLSGKFDQFFYLFHYISKIWCDIGKSVMGPSVSFPYVPIMTLPPTQQEEMNQLPCTPKAYISSKNIHSHIDRRKSSKEK